MKPTFRESSIQYALIWLWHWLPPILLMAAIFYLSHQPDLPRAPDPLLDVLLKKLGHATEYAVLFLLLVRAWSQSQTGDRVLDTSLLTTAAYAISDELHQAFVPGRRANWYDILIDASVALLLWRFLRGGRLGWLFRRKDQDLAE
ncbi:MAG: hypothetical protein AMJ93_11200 [Anaerolineae bacterium SM23_84]|nr:MAG: hypothetical protein AMJ93_11200 [Anaerolineae bacterium SM23_84]